MTQPASPDLCIATVRTLAIDAVQQANSGHPGAPMGLAPVGWALYSRLLRHAPGDPSWPNRDRFVLSAGHASALQYALLHLAGYDLTLDDLKAFRQWGSRTPGHPERGHVPGVEVTTGPLGQGLGNAVGLALAEAMLAAEFNRPGHDVVDHRTWVIASDGDLMEGISHESCSLAGFLGLGKLVVIFDDNAISLDGPTDMSTGDDVSKRFDAYGWRVLEIADANDQGEIDRVLDEAEAGDGRPTLVRYRSAIGYGAPHVQGTSKAHGAPLGADEARLAKQAYGWPEDAQFLVPDEVAAWAPVLRERGAEMVSAWDAAMASYAAAFPDEAAELRRRIAGDLPEGWDADLPRFDEGESPATRVASTAALNAIAARVPELVGGAADLASSTGTVIKDGGDIGPGSFAGRNIHFGVREFGMAAAVNGMVAHGGFRAYGSTFMTFSDYMKNAIRMAALQRLPSILVFTHDSVAVGEDGPTHQPVEQLAALRSIPGLVTLRPADARETAQAWRIAVARADGPTALVLTRQGVPVLPVDDPPVDRGAYVLAPGDDCILIATGSEVSLALEARDLLAADGVSARVVSMPSWELFAAQPDAYRDEVLPPAVMARVSVEAASTFGWARWTGTWGRAVGIDRFGESAPGGTVMERLGMTAGAVADAARESIAVAPA
ncbi:MAG: transketolase [Acidobacteria bacterium]|nr:transketolase [Acidobacteriota bacterium]